jgi:hypothetical protein
MLTGREIVIKAFLIVDEKGRTLFGIEWRKPFELAPRFGEFHPPPDHRRSRQARAYLFENGGRVTHGLDVSLLLKIADAIATTNPAGQFQQLTSLSGFPAAITAKTGGIR